jgi:hypothetical protein
MATFNADAALKAGYTELQIAEFLGQQNKFNTAAAILDFFNKPVAPITPAIKIPMMTITAESSIRVKADL